ACEGGRSGTAFAVWAPEADGVWVSGDFNQWHHQETPLQRLGATGVWVGFAPGAGHGSRYQYVLSSPPARGMRHKRDPVGRAHEAPPARASIISHDPYPWEDAAWMLARARRGVPPVVPPLCFVDLQALAQQTKD